MENVVENSLELTNHLVGKHWDKGWDKYQKFVNGKKVEEAVVPYRGPYTSPNKQNPDSLSRSSSSNRRNGKRTPEPATASRVRSATGLHNQIGGAAAATALGADTYTAAPSGSRRHRNTLPSPERERSSRRASITYEEEYAAQVREEFNAETDDPPRRAESVLDSVDLRYLRESKSKTIEALSGKGSRRDSAMAGYNDDYRSNTGYASEAPRPRSQPPRSRYYDDDDSDYDERSGTRYNSGSGRGYDDRDYDRVVEETERYRGPVSAGPLVPVNRPFRGREDSYRSDYDRPGAGAVTQYGRRSDVDRQSSYVSRRSKSRGRDRDDRSYSRTPSESRSRSRERGGGIGDKIQGAFDTSGRGLGVGIAGAVIGGLAGREFGNKHRQRDIILGAIVGGLGANAAENQYKQYKERKEGGGDERWDDRRDIGRSRSNVR